MSHSYSFRHGKSQSVSSSSGGHQRISYGSRSTSTGTPPQTPTIRVTSPIPDAIGVIDIWDPEVVEDDPPQTTAAETSPKTYSFRYTEEKQTHKKHKRRHSDKKTKKNFADSAMQADPPPDPVQQVEEPEPAMIVVQPKLIHLLDSSPVDDDGLKTAGESEESSDEVSQISAVTQIPRCVEEPERSPEAEEEEEPEITAVEKDENLPIVAEDNQRRWDEMHPLDEKPVKRVQFSRSLSLVPGSNASQSAAGQMLTDRVRSGAGRRYSSMDSGAGSVGLPLELFPTTLAFGDQQTGSTFPPSSRLSPTPESALENAQSPQQDDSQQQPPQQSCTNTMTELSGNGHSSVIALNPHLVFFFVTAIDVTAVVFLPSIH